MHVSLITDDTRDIGAYAERANKLPKSRPRVEADFKAVHGTAVLKDKDTCVEDGSIVQLLALLTREAELGSQVRVGGQELL